MAPPRAGPPIHDTAATIMETHRREGTGGDIETGKAATWAGVEAARCTIVREPGTLRRGDVVSEDLTPPMSPMHPRPRAE